MTVSFQHLISLLIAVFLAIGSAQADESATLTGPVIEDFGPVLPVDSQFNLEPNTRYRTVFDVSKSADDPTAINRSIESAARFLNMHARTGIDPANLEVAIVLHGSAGKDALSDDAYRERFESDNPNSRLLKSLESAGVQIWICGQTAAYRGFAADEIHTSVGMALSAMTVLTRLQSEGWAFLPW